MKLPDRRKFLHLAAGAAALPALSSVAQAQAWPNRPVRLVVGFPAGGGADAAARMRALEARAELATDPTWKALLFVDLAELSAAAAQLQAIQRLRRRK